MNRVPVAATRPARAAAICPCRAAAACPSHAATCPIRATACRPAPGAARLLPAALLAGFLFAAGGAAAEEQAWTQGIDDEIGWETVRTLSQTSADGIPDEYASKEVHPVLSFRCTEGGDGRIAMQIDWRRFISSFNTEAGFKIDDGERQWIELRVDDSNRVTLARPSPELETLVGRMIRGQSLNVEISPYSEPSVSVGFDLASLPAAYDSLGAACRAAPAK